jgi:O-glycosyl hydrolase
VERWPGQAAALVEMAEHSGIEGFAAEYWSPAPAWKTNDAFIDGELRGTDAAFLADFAAAVATDARYLAAQGLHLAWWGLQNEPYVGPSGCIYSCCGINASTYALAFAAAAEAVRADFPEAVIHASSGQGQRWSPQLLANPAALALVDAWTWHRVGADSNDQIANRDYLMGGAAGRPTTSSTQRSPS